MKKQWLQLCFLIWLLTACNHLIASGGVMEINQVCALNGGCFSGDTAGFPVTIDGSEGVSYRLTGSLDLSSVPDTTAIEIDAPYITLDLNGFEVRGPISCTGSGPTLNCGAVGSGDGVALSANADFVTIRNGTIRNMARHGVGAAGNELRITDVTARHNARDGLNGGSNSIATNCIAHENGNDGFQFGSGSVIQQSAAFGNGEDGIRIENSNGVIDNSTARNNGLQGFEMGHSSKFGKNSSTGNGAPDSCGGGICTSDRRFYLTSTLHKGNEVLAACQAGFGPASFWELFDTSNLTYDTILGLGTSGPVLTPGTYSWAEVDYNDPTDNCSLWTDDDGGLLGTGFKLVWGFDFDDPATTISPWETALISCAASRQVWCIEDL